MRTLTLLGAAVLLGACATGRAYREPLVTDRPDFTESAVPVPYGSVQVEMGDTFDRTDGTRANTAGEVLVRVGMVRGAELRLGLSSLVHAPGVSTAREDGSLGAKVQLLAERSQPSFVPAASLLLGTSLPTGSRAVRSAALTPEAKLALGWSLGETWGLSTNLNVASIPDAGSRSVETVGSLSLGHDLNDRVGSYLEWYGARSSGVFGGQYANAGVTYALGANAQLDVRAGAGVAKARGDYFFGLGMARRW